MSEPLTDLTNAATTAITFAEGTVKTFEQLLGQYLEALTIVDVLLPAVDEARLSDDDRAALPGARDAVTSAKRDAPAVRQLIESQRASLKNLRTAVHSHKAGQ